MTETVKQNNPDYLHGSDQTIVGTENEDVLGGFTEDDTLVGQGSDDILPQMVIPFLN